MNGAVKRTKQLRRFIGKLLMIFFFFALFISLLFFLFFFESSEGNLPKPLKGNSVWPRDFVLMKLQNYETRGQEYAFHNIWAEWN